MCIVLWDMGYSGTKKKYVSVGHCTDAHCTFQLQHSAGSPASGSGPAVSLLLCHQHGPVCLPSSSPTHPPGGWGLLHHSPGTTGSLSHHLARPAGVPYVCPTGSWLRWTTAGSDPCSSCCQGNTRYSV